MRNRLQQIFNIIGTWGWPAKFLLGAAISAFAGGGILGFLLQNAAYYFALSYGFRPPVEGVPYLVAMITIGSITLLLLAALLTAAVVMLVKEMGIKAIEWVDTAGTQISSMPSLLQKLRSLSFLVVMPIILIVAFATAWIMKFIFPLVRSPLEVCAWPVLLCLPESGDDLFAFSLSYVVSVIILLMIWRPSIVWLGSAALVAFQYIWIAVSVLPPEGYGRLLRMTGFGGGILVTVEFDPKEHQERIEANLLIRSNTHLFLFVPAQKAIREFPLAAIHELRHRDGGLHTLPFKLPLTVQLMQR